MNARFNFISKYIIAVGALFFCAFFASAEKVASKTITKKFYGSEVTGNWINPCSGETLYQLATIREKLTPCPQGCLITAIMYNADGKPIKGGFKLVKGRPGIYPLVPLTNMTEFSVSDFPTLEKEIEIDKTISNI